MSAPKWLPVTVLADEPFTPKTMPTAATMTTMAIAGISHLGRRRPSLISAGASLPLWISVDMTGSFRAQCWSDLTAPPRGERDGPDDLPPAGARGDPDVQHLRRDLADRVLHQPGEERDAGQAHRGDG